MKTRNIEVRRLTDNPNPHLTGTPIEIEARINTFGKEIARLMSQQNEAHYPLKQSETSKTAESSPSTKEEHGSKTGHDSGWAEVLDLETERFDNLDGPAAKAENDILRGGLIDEKLSDEEELEKFLKGLVR